MCNYHKINARILIATLLSASLLACNSGGSGWTAGSLGTLSVAINPATFGVGESAVVTASLSNVTKGTDQIGSATLTFYIVQNNSLESANIAIFDSKTNTTTCIINKPDAESTPSCSVSLKGLYSGHARINVAAAAQNTDGTNNGLVFESFNVIAP